MIKTVKPWRLTKMIDTDALIFRREVSADLGFCWMKIDPARGSLSATTNAARSEFQIQGGRPLCLQDHHRLIVGGGRGISTYDFVSGVETVYKALSERESVDCLWRSATSDQLLILKSNWTQKTALASGESLQHFENCSVYECDLDLSNRHELHRLPAMPASIELNRKAGEFVMTIGRELLQMNIKTGKSRRQQLDAPALISAANNGSSFVMTLGEGKLFELDGKGKMRLILNAVALAAPSPHGDRIMAKTTRGELLVISRGRPETIAELRHDQMSFRAHHAWCDCGNHFAISVASKAPARFSVLIVDIEKKEIMSSPHDSSFNGAITWIPRSAIGKGRTSRV